MTSPGNDALFSLLTWKPALEKYAIAAHLTVKLFDSGGRAVLGPIHSTPLFRLFEEAGYDPCIFTECARRCLAQVADHERPPVIVNQVHGLTVLGTSLVLENRIVGAVVGGYAFADFSQVSEIQRLAREAGIAFQRIWEVARTQKPIPQSRLIVNGELLQVLGDALLRENYRTRQYAETAAIVEFSDDAIVSKDLDGVILSWNPGAERLFGYTAREAIGQPITMLIPADHVDEEPAILERIRNGKRIDHYETVRQRKDGTLLDLSLTISPIRDTHGKIVGASKIARDITERKEAEEQLRVSEERFRMVADNMAQLAWTCEHLGVVTWYNRRWLDYTGMTFQELEGWGWSKIQHPDYVDRVVQGVKRSGDTGETWEDTFPLRGKDGKYRWFLSRAVPIRDADGKVVRWFGTNTDVTDRRLTEAALIKSEKLAAAGRLAATLAHEINNPLQAVTNLVTLLGQSPKLDLQEQEYARMATEELGRVTHLTRQSLSFYRDAVHPTEVNVEEMVESVLNLYNKRLTAKEIAVTTQYRSHETIHSYPGEIRQVFSTLLVNAMEAVPAGGTIAIRVRRSSQWKTPRILGVRIHIADNGVGIPTPDTARIFEAFFTTKGEQGTGLGLWVTNGIVNRLGGSIRVRSSVCPKKRGTCFSIFLPNQTPDKV